MAGDPYLKSAILNVVEIQVRTKEPPEATQTLERLMAAGHSRERAVELIGAALVEELWQMLHEGQAFDPARYRSLLEGIE